MDPIYRRARTPDQINTLTTCLRPRLRITGSTVTRSSGIADFEAWLDNVTPFSTVGTEGQFEAWFDSITPFTELV